MERKLLIAEDNMFTLTQYKKFLEANGYKVTVCSDGLQCITKYFNEIKYRQVVLKDDSPPFDFVLLDHDMPKMNGSDVAFQIHKQCPKQRIYFLSAYGQNIIRAYPSSKDDCLQILQKPFSLEFLLKKLQPKLFSSVARTNQENNLLTATQSNETIS